jgi:hypothetical protein
MYVCMYVHVRWTDLLGTPGTLGDGTLTGMGMGMGRWGPLAIVHGTSLLWHRSEVPDTVCRAPARWDTLRTRAFNLPNYVRSYVCSYLHAQVSYAPEGIVIPICNCRSPSLSGAGSGSRPDGTAIVSYHPPAKGTAYARDDGRGRVVELTGRVGWYGVMM